jgi:hypothetical protein
MEKIVINENRVFSQIRGLLKELKKRLSGQWIIIGGMRILVNQEME